MKEVQARLGMLRAKWRFNRGSTWLAILPLVIIFTLSIFGLIETALWLNPAAKSVLFIIFFILTALPIFIFLYNFAAVYIYKNTPSDIGLAKITGLRLDDIRDRLVNAIQVFQSPDIVEEGYSEVLREEALREIAPDFLQADLEKIIDRRGLMRNLKISAVTFILLPILFFQGYRSGLSRFFHPLQAYQKPLPFFIELIPGDVTILEGDTLRIEAVVQGGSPRELEFHIISRRLSAESGETKIIPASADNEFHLEIPSILHSFEYYARSGRVASPRYHAEVKSPPKIRSMRLTLNPPGYSGLPQMKLDENVGDIISLPGTTAEFELTSQSELARAYLVFNNKAGDCDTIEFASAGNEASGRMRILQPGQYHFQLEDTEELHSRYPIKYRVELMPDLAPMVDIVSPGTDLELSGAGNLLLLTEAEDDFGIKDMRIEYRILSAFSSDTTAETEHIDLHFTADPDGIYRADYLWDLEALQLIPGDMLEYFAEVHDNDNINGPKYGRSKTYTLRLPTMAEMYEAMEQAESEGIEEMKRVLEGSKDIHEEITKAIDEIRRKGDLDWSEKRDLKEDLNQQEKLIDKLEQAKNTVEEMMRKAEEGSLLSMEIMQKYSELQKLMSDVYTQEMLKSLQELYEALEQQDPEKLRMAAEQFEMTQEEFLKQIEKQLEIMKQLQLERQLEELIRRTEEMAQRQNEIADESENVKEDKLEQLAGQEDALKRDMEDLLNRMEDTESLASERDEITSGELDSLHESSQSLPQDMGQMSGDIKQGQRMNASQKGKEISQRMSQMSRKLSQIKQDMVQRQKDDLAKELMKVVQDLTTLSHQQEDLKNVSGDISVRSPQYREQGSLQAGIGESLSRVTDEVFRLSQKSFFVSSNIGQSLGRALSMIEGALNSYTARNPRSVSSQQSTAMSSMNKAAADILNVISQLQGSSSATGFDEMMEQLRQMAGQQAGLNQETQSMMMPGAGNPGGLSMSQMEGMGRLAAQQRALQQSMEELAQQAENMGGLLGDMGHIAEQMGEAADSLKDRHVGDRTLKIQERILSRLLDAQKSVRTQKVSKKRQSKTGEDLVRSGPKAFPEDTIEDLLRRDILRAMKEGYASDYQKLIQQYFRALYQSRVENIDK